jgi:hypothetical protein
MVVSALAIIAGVIGLLLLFAVAFGTLTPHFVAVAIICLAAAVFIMNWSTWRKLP